MCLTAPTMYTATSALAVHAKRLPKNGSAKSEKPPPASAFADCCIVPESVVNEAQKPAAKKSPDLFALGKNSLKSAYKNAPNAFTARICKT